MDKSISLPDVWTWRLRQLFHYKQRCFVADGRIKNLFEKRKAIKNEKEVYNTVPLF